MRLILMLTLLLWLSAVQAVQMNSIYQAAIPVQSQSEGERNHVLPQALGQTLVKISGTKKILDNASLKSQLNRAESLMQAYSYTMQKKGYQLNVQFDAETLTKLLQEAAVPIWGVDRPLVVAWIVSEGEKHQLDIMNSNNINEMTIAFKEAADRRGLPLILPVMDMTDTRLVSPQDILTMKLTSLQTASKRYVGDAIVMGEISHVSNSFFIKAHLVQDSHQWEINAAGKSKVEVINALIDSAVDTLAAQYATVVSNQIQERLILQVTHIQKQEDYEALIQYLQHLPSVASVAIENVNGNQVTLNLSLQSSRDSFAQNILIGKKLTPVSDEAGNNQFTYQWNQ